MTALAVSAEADFEIPEMNYFALCARTPLQDFLCQQERLAFFFAGACR
jgi:hypothetical protein